MLSEMDGFEATEGIVMMAATNRPDILDPALLRPGRFDRQVVVPLPELEERLAILKVHAKGKRIASDVDLATVARARPACPAPSCRTSSTRPPCSPCGRAPTRSTPATSSRPATACSWAPAATRWRLSRPEKELTAYHEAGHAVCAAVLPHADPLHKVTILPMGMALGVTQQLPAEDRHSYDQAYLEDRLCISMGGAWPRRSCSTSCPPAAPTTSRPPPSSPARWCGSGACRPASVRWRGAPRVPCSSART